MTAHDARPVQRFSLEQVETAAWMDNNPNGDWVLFDDYDALRAEVERLQNVEAQLRHEQECHKQTLRLRVKAEGRASRVACALIRLQHNFRLLLSGKPVRDVTETLAEVDTALNYQGQDNG